MKLRLMDQFKIVLAAIGTYGFDTTEAALLDLPADAAKYLEQKKYDIFMKIIDGDFHKNYVKAHNAINLCDMYTRDFRAGRFSPQDDNEGQPNDDSDEDPKFDMPNNCKQQ